MYRLDTVLLDPHMIYWIILSQYVYMPCYFQCDSCKRENSFYTESHTRSLKITWHIYCDCKYFTQSPETFWSDER